MSAKLNAKAAVDPVTRRVPFLTPDRELMDEGKRQPELDDGGIH